MYFESYEWKSFSSSCVQMRIESLYVKWRKGIRQKVLSFLF